MNWGHKALQASALPTELKSRIVEVLVPIIFCRLYETAWPLLYDYLRFTLELKSRIVEVLVPIIFCRLYETAWPLLYLF